MREIKFRAWDEVEKRFWHFDLNEVLKRHLSYVGSWDVKIATGKKEQYTGFEDVNDKEIYEGEIAEYYSLLNGGLQLGVVTFENGCWHIGECYLHHKNVKIVGNVCENKDLIMKGFMR